MTDENKLTDTGVSYLNERFQLLLDATQEVIRDWNIVENTLWWSENSPALPGYPHQPIESGTASWSTRLHPDDHNRVVDDLQTALRQLDTHWSAEYRLRRPDNTYGHYLERARIVYEANEPVRFVGSLMDITDRVERRHTSQDSERQMRAALDAVGLGIWSVYPLENKIRWDERCQDLYHWPNREVALTDLLHYIHPDDQAPIYDALVKTPERESGDASIIEYRLTRPDTAMKWIRLNGRAYFDEQGRANYFTGTALDITAEKEREASSKVEETRLQLIFTTLLEAISPMTWMQRATGEIEYFNQRWYDYTGLSFAETAGFNWQTVLHPDDVDRTWAICERAIATGESFTVENRYKRASDGQHRWHINRIIPLKNETGTITQWVGTATDIEELKQTEAELEQRVAERTEELDRARHDVQRTAETLQNMLDGALNGIILLNPIHNPAGEIIDFKIEAANRTVQALTGVDPDQMTGRTMLDVFPGYVAGGFFALYVNALRTDRPGRGEYYYEDATLTGWYEVSAIKWGNGLVLTFTNTTETKLAQQQLRQLVDDLRRSNDNLQQFAFVASHDLQEPLRKIQQFGSILKESYTPALDERGTYMVDRMESAAQRMSVLIRDLLEYSRLTTRTQTLQPQDLKHLVGEVLADLDVRVQETGAVVEVGDLCVVPGDETQLTQLLQNLFSNALNFTKRDESGRPVPPRIRVSSHTIRCEELPGDFRPVENYANYCVIRVSDNGIGFEQKQAERIFGTFQRLHSRDQYKGTGIGLAIAKKVVENHRGYIMAESQPGDGATFTVYLPV